MPGSDLIETGLKLALCLVQAVRMGQKPALLWELLPQLVLSTHLAPCQRDASKQR